MEQNKNPESPRAAFRSSGDEWWEDWDGQDSSIRHEPCEPEDDGLPSPHLEPGEQTWVEAEQERRARGEPPQHSLPGEELAPSAVEGLPHELPRQPAPDYGLPPEVAEARRRQGLTWPPKRTGTGFFYRNGDEIPPTHPDHGPMHLIPRQEDGSFAAYYYCSKAELACMRNPAPPPRRRRRDGFSPERQQLFVEYLRDTASFTDAARLTGISRSTAYNLYNSPDAGAFRAAVGEALKCTEPLLEATALERAIKGHEEIVYYKGRRVGVRWKADNRLLMSLLRARNPLKYAPLNEIEGWLRCRGLEPPADFEGALDRLAAAEAEWGCRLPGEELPVRPAIAAAPLAPALEAPPPSLALSAHPEQGSSDAGLDAFSPVIPAKAGIQAVPETAPRVEEPVQASTSSTLGPETPVQASTSSTLEAEQPVQASTSSTLPAEPPAAAHEPGMAIPYRPPPKPRLRSG